MLPGVVKQDQLCYNKLSARTATAVSLEPLQAIYSDSLIAQGIPKYSTQGFISAPSHITSHYLFFRLQFIGWSRPSLLPACQANEGCRPLKSWRAPGFHKKRTWKSGCHYRSHNQQL
jgi:hypothetical protein